LKPERCIFGLVGFAPEMPGGGKPQLVWFAKASTIALLCIVACKMAPLRNSEAGKIKRHYFEKYVLR